MWPEVLCLSINDPVKSPVPSGIQFPRPQPTTIVNGEFVFKEFKKILLLGWVTHNQRPRLVWERPLRFVLRDARAFLSEAATD